MENVRFSSGPLGNLRVLELSDVIGEWCGKLMADLGADVIKIEPPGGAAERQIGPFYQDVPHPERSLHFWHYNTSKRGITLNLETEDGRELFRKMVTTADVLLETYQPGYLPTRGLGYQELQKINPQLVMCSLTPFGQTGPWSHYRSSDRVHMAAGGQMASTGYNEEDVPDPPPIAAGGGNAWHMGSHYAYIAIMAAVCMRDVTGEGQYIDASVHSACALTTEGAIPTYLFTKQVMRRNTGRHHSVGPSARSQHPTKDGHYVNYGIMGRLTPDRLKVWADWMDSHGIDHDFNDPKYMKPGALQEHQAHINEMVEHFFANVTQEEAYRGGQERGFLVGAVRAPEDNLDDRHWYDRGFWVEVEHPELGKSFTYPGGSAIYPKSPWQISRRAPLISEHNEEVCSEIGVDLHKLAVLRETGVI
jgi:crotonobetainyl-CoA:carnitine CoA-transferase CaiB-like acyl-CoA transferase